MDGELDVDETRRLNDILRRDTERRAEFVDLCLQTQLIREYAESVLDAGPPVDNVNSPFDNGASPVESAKPVESVNSPAKSKGYWSAGRVGLYGAITTALLALIFISMRLTPNPSTVSVSQLDGKVFLVRGEQRLAVTAKLTVHNSDTIIVAGSKGRAELTYADGSLLKLAGDASMTLDQDGRKIRLDAGTLTAAIAPQLPGRQLTLSTNYVDVRVLGTTFTIAAGDDRTDVSVDEGRVKMTQVTDGDSVDIVEGEFAVADNKRKLVAHNIPRPPDTWEADFEGSLPSKWRSGKFESVGLPVNSRGAVRAERVESEDGVFYQIESQKMWSEGIFSIHEDSHLQITLKVERPDWFQLFIATRPFDSELPPTSLYRFRDQRLWKWSNRNRWLRVTIPLTAFERVPEKKGTPPLGEVPFELLFSAKGEDRGLVIDQVSVSRGGPNRIVIEEITP